MIENINKLDNNIRGKYNDNDLNNPIIGTFEVNCSSIIYYTFKKSITNIYFCKKSSMTKYSKI